MDELLTHIATFLPNAASLVAFECVSIRFASVPHEAAWRSLCERRWSDKPRYRLTDQRQQELNTHMSAVSWRRRYATFEVDGQRSSITEEELSSLGWYFNYTPDAGGLGRETLRRVHFKQGRLAVPDYPELPYALIGQAGLVGSRVVASGLKARPELNGQAGRVLSLDAPAARYTVLFDTGEKLRLSLLNVHPAPPQQGPPAGLARLASTLPLEAQQLTIANFPKHHVTRLPSWEWRIYNDNVTFVSCDEVGTLTYFGRGFNAERHEVIQQQAANAAVLVANAAAPTQVYGSEEEGAS